MVDRQHEEVKLRTATRTDAKAIGELNAAAWQVAYSGIVPERVLEERRSREEDPAHWWRTLSSPGRVNAIASSDGDVAGYSSWAPCGPSDGDPAKCAELLGLYVHPERWRCGIGKRLFLDVARAARSSGRAEMVIWVLEENVRARRFYEAIGCVIERATRTVPKLQDPGVLEVRYRADLSARGALTK